MSIFYNSIRFSSIMLIAIVLLIFSGCSCNESCISCPPSGNDTTSHDFQWQVFQLGDVGSSVLYDVAIINDTLAYACGVIYSSGSIYNLARWNGHIWELSQIQFYTICGQSSLTPYPASSIFAFSENDIWISMDGDQVARWKGSAQTATMCLPVSFSIKKLWVENSTSVYAVGDGGNIVHYDGNHWQKIESGTNTHIKDIYGIYNRDKRQHEIYCAVTSFFQQGDKKILKISETGDVDSVSWTTGRDVVSVWSSDGSFLYACGDGFFENSSGEWREINYGEHVYTNHVRGSAANNIVVVGDFGMISHFNGNTWRVYYPSTSATYNGVAVTNTMVIAVGQMNGKAVAVIGKRPK